LVVHDSGWSLPQVALDERHTADVEYVIAAVRQKWGLDTVVLAGLDYSARTGTAAYGALTLFSPKRQAAFRSRSTGASPGSRVTSSLSSLFGSTS
jgi:hypothetical protein